MYIFLPLSIVAGKSYDRRIYPLPDRSYRICGTDPELRGSGDHRSHNPADRNLHAEGGRQVRVCPLGHRLTVSQALTLLNTDSLYSSTSSLRVYTRKIVIVFILNFKRQTKLHV